MEKSPGSVKVPPEATAVTTPLQPKEWQRLLREHPDNLLTNYFITDLSNGFRVDFCNPPSKLRSAHKNLLGALQHPQVVDDYLKVEITERRVVGPFRKADIPDAHISRFGVIPKQHKPDKWRLIVDLSHPVDLSVNDGIPKELCSLSYITVDTAINHIMELGQGALLAMMDIKSAFHLLPVHPSDRHLLAIEWNKGIYIDTCLPFGLRSAPKLFNILADLLSWILDQKGASPTIHYLDDFLTMGPAKSPTCHSNLNIMLDVSKQLGIPLALDKLEGPSHCLTFLGIVLDTQQMQARLPEEKLSHIKCQLSTWLHRKKATKRQILSLVGLLQHAGKVVQPGRTFMAAMYSTAAKVKKLAHFSRLNKSFRSDLYWWHIFFNNWNGISLLRSATPSYDYHIYMDASGSWGFGVVFASYWFQLPWSTEWSSINIMAKELVPIIISCAVWGPILQKSSAEFHCDNQGLVAAINKGSSKDTMVMHLLRCLWFFTAAFDINITATHISGKSNNAADMLSRNQAAKFLETHPDIPAFPTPLPPSILHLVSPQKLDWTSPTFHRLFRKIYLHAQQYLKLQ